MDQAQGHNEDFQTYALQQQKIGRELDNYTGSDCLECGGEIPEKRRQAMPGCRRCIECQTLLETWRPL